MGRGGVVLEEGPDSVDAFDALEACCVACRIRPVDVSWARLSRWASSSIVAAHLGRQ